MKIGCVVRPEHIEAVRHTGYDYFELHARDVASMSDADFNRLQKLIEKHYDCYAMNAYCGPEIQIVGEKANSENTRAYAAHLAERASALGVKVVGIGSPLSRRIPPYFSKDLAWEQAVQFFHITGEEFARYGIIVAIEALAPSYCNFINTNSDAMKLAAQTGLQNVRILVDFYSMRLAGQEEEDLSLCSAQIAHVHLSDDNGDPFLRSWFHESALPLHRQEWVTLKKIGYDKNVTLEVDLPYHAEWAKKTLTFLRDIETGSEE